MVAKAAWDVQQRILTKKRTLQRIWISLAEDLYQFAAAKMWADLGYDSLHQWMSDPDVELDRSDGYLLIQIWKELVVQQGVDPERIAEVEKSKVREILKPVKAGVVSVQEALADAEVLTRQDLHNKYEGQAAKQTPNGKVPDTSTHYDAEAEPEWARCHFCNSWYQPKVVE